MMILKSNKLPMMNGEKTVMKQYTKLGSKLLMLAIFPVPKNAKTMKNSWSSRVKGKYDKFILYSF